MPMSLNDIQADKDQLRAEFAIELRKVEVALDKAKEKATRELIEANKRRVEIAMLNTDLASAKSQLQENENANRVLQQTIKRRLPDLDSRLKAAKKALAELEVGQCRASHHGCLPVRGAQDRAHDLAQSARRHRPLAHGLGKRQRRRLARIGQARRPHPRREPALERRAVQGSGGARARQDERAREHAAPPRAEPARLADPCRGAHARRGAGSSSQGGRSRPGLHPAERDRGAASAATRAGPAWEPAHVGNGAAHEQQEEAEAGGEVDTVAAGMAGAAYDQDQRSRPKPTRTRPRAEATEGLVCAAIRRPPRGAARAQSPAARA